MSTNAPESPPAGPSHARILAAVGEGWPEHRPFLTRSVEVVGAAGPTVERVSELVLRLTGDDLSRHIAGYRWMCEMVLGEELEFRRKGRYRYATFEEVVGRVYGDREVMGRYMDGLLLSQVLWGNHIRILDFYARVFVGKIPTDAAHLEVGPGHGLLLYLASNATSGRVVGWDLSETSLAHSRAALDRLGARPGIELEDRDLFAPGGTGEFQSVTFSEVLEHVERPDLALAGLHARMTPGGRLFVNAPVNSPAVDHIYLFRTPEEVVELVSQAGFDIEATCFAPSTGYTEERARKMRTSISAAVIGVRR